jgi:glycosyl transferase family 87
MAVSERAARLVLGALLAALLAAAALIDLPERSGHQFWSDGATYYSMAWSLARDGDLRYEARDLLRVRRGYGSNPEGIFLKRTPDQRPGRSPGGAQWRWAPEGGFPWIHRVDEPRIHYAKAFAYPLAVAPFVAVLGNRGFLVANALFFGVAVACAYAELRRRRLGPGAALAVTVVLLGLSVAPLYVLWMQPEILGLALIAAGLTAGARGRPFLAAVLLGVAVYAKPYNVFLALPLGVAPLLAPRGQRLRGLRESVARGLVLALTTIALFGLNRLATGELNYQGGERKTFYRHFPEEPEPRSDGSKTTFGNSGEWMTTDYLGPLVEGRDDEKVTRTTGPARPAEEIRASFVRNLGYFWVGRFGGALAYYPGAVLAVIVFLLAGPRDREGALALAALVASWLFYIIQIPDNWYGGGGTVGNRYFLNLLPLTLYLVPAARVPWVVVPGALLSALFTVPILWSPLAHSLQPSRHALRAPFRALPAELTMLNDLSASTDAWRKKRPFGDTEGDPHKGWPADPKSYFLYFLDEGTYGKQVSGGEEGFWLRGGESGEIVLRALEPVRRMKVQVAGGPAGDEVTVRLAGESATVTVGPGQAGEASFTPPRGFRYNDTFLYVLRFRSRRSAPAPDGSPRPVGAFVTIAIDPSPRPR